MPPKNQAGDQVTSCGFLDKQSDSAMTTFFDRAARKRTAYYEEDRHATGKIRTKNVQVATGGFLDKQSDSAMTTRRGIASQRSSGEAICIHQPSTGEKRDDLKNIRDRL